MPIYSSASQANPNIWFPGSKGAIDNLKDDEGYPLSEAERTHVLVSTIMSMCNDGQDMMETAGTKVHPAYLKTSKTRHPQRAFTSELLFSLVSGSVS